MCKERDLESIEVKQCLRQWLRSYSHTVLNRSACRFVSTCTLRTGQNDITTLCLHGMWGQESRVHDLFHQLSSPFVFSFLLSVTQPNEDPPPQCAAEPNPEHGVLQQRNYGNLFTEHLARRMGSYHLKPKLLMTLNQGFQRQKLRARGCR